MHFKGIINMAASFAKSHSSEILTCVSIVGTGAAAYLAFKGGMNTEAILNERMEQGEELTKKDVAKVVIKEAAPAAGVIILTWASIVSSGIISYRRAKALGTLANAYLTTTEFANAYRSQVVKTMGKDKDEEIVGAVGQDLINNDPPSNSIIFNTGEGNTLFKDRITGRYFRSDLDFIRRQQVEINNWLAAGEDWVSVNEWFSLIGLEQCDDLDGLGWNVEEKVKFDLAACLSPENEPCILINYDISPRMDIYGFC